MDDFRANRQPAHCIPIEGNRYTGTQSLKGSVAKYVQIRDAAPGVNIIQGIGNQMGGGVEGLPLDSP